MACGVVLRALSVFLFIFVCNMPSIFCCVPCAEISHSQCEDIHEYSFLNVDVLDKSHCHMVCQGLEPFCKFFIFDHFAFAEGNCKLFDESFSNALLHCNEVVGPKAEVPGCNIANPEDDTCQIYRSGNCDIHSNPEETFAVHTPELCQMHCQATTQCKMWQFLKEEQECRLMYSSAKSCKWEFCPRKPELADCDGYCPLSTTSPPPQTTNDHKKTTVTTSEPSRPCITVGGPGAGQPCVFPFMAKGNIYNSCTYDGGYPDPWCATQVDQNDAITEYGDCPLDDPNCPIDEDKIQKFGKELNTKDGSRLNDRHHNNWKEVINEQLVGGASKTYVAVEAT